MIKWLLKRFRRDPSVDKIVSSFNKTVNKLELVAQHKDEESKTQQAAAVSAEARARNAEIEAARARAVSENLSKLVAG